MRVREYRCLLPRFSLLFPVGAISKRQTWKCVVLLVGGSSRTVCAPSLYNSILNNKEQDRNILAKKAHVLFLKTNEELYSFDRALRVWAWT